MKKLIISLTLLIVIFSVGLAQPSNGYIFQAASGAPDAYAYVRNVSTASAVASFPNLPEESEIVVLSSYSVQTQWDLDHWFTGISPTITRYTMDMSNTVNYLITRTYLTVSCYWSPTITPKGTIKTSTASEDIDVYRSYIGISQATRHLVEIDRSIRLEAVSCPSCYSGTDIQWYIQTASGSPVLFATGNPVTVTGKSIVDLIGFNTKFIFLPMTPNYRVSGTNIIKEYRECYEKLGPIEISPKNLELVDPADATGEICDGNIRLRIDANEARTIDWQVGQVPDGQDQYVFETFSQSTLPSNGYYYHTVNYPELQGYVHYPAKAFALRAVYHGTDELYANPINGLQFFPSRTLFTTSEQKKACIEGTAGTLRVSRTNTLYEEKFEFLDGSDPAPIETFYMKPGKAYTDLTGFDPGAYQIHSVLIMDTNHTACQSSTVTQTITEYPRPSLSMINNLSPWCEYDHATINVEPGLVNGSGTSSYNLYNAGGTYNQTITGYIATFTGVNIESEPYYVRFRDPAGCFSLVSTIAQSSIPDINFSVDKTQPACYGDATGSLTISSVTGSPGSNYQYSVGSGFSSNPNFSGLYGTDYTVTVRDASNPTCFTSKEEIIDQPDPLTYNDPASSINHIDCHGDVLDGSIRLFGSGGTAPLYYNLTSGVNSYLGISLSNPLTGGLPAGEYQGWLSDAHGCTSDTLPSLVITETPKIRIIGIEPETESCTNTNDGSIEILSVAGGGGGYTYHWSNGQSTPVAVNLHAGTEYNLTITDNMDCDIDTSFVLDAPQTIQATVHTISPTCRGGSNGSLVIDNITFGNPGYTYSLSSTGTFTPYTAGVTISGLTPGNYNLYIRDALYNSSTAFSSCSAVIPFQVIDKQVVEIDTDITIPDCFGNSTGGIDLTINSGPGNTNNYTYQWRNGLGTIVSTSQDLINAPAGAYTLTVYDEQSCPVNFGSTVIADPSELIISNVAITDASCNEVSNGRLTISASGGTEADNYHYSIGGGFVYNQPVFENLAAGEYTVAVRDDNGCITSVTESIDAGEVLISLTDTSMIRCNGDGNGSINVLASGGTNSYRYYLTGPGLNTNTTSTIFSGLEAGEYQLHAYDMTSTCRSDTIIVPITEPDPILISTTVDSASCSQQTGSIEYTVAGGNGGYSIRWEDSDGNSINESNLDALGTDTYTIFVTDSKLCATQEDVIVPERLGPEITGHELLDIAWCDMPTGQVELTVENGSPAFHYTWSHQAGLDSPVASALPADTYTVTITDNYNCSDIYSFELENGPAIVPAYTTIDANCNMDDGSATLSVSGGVPPYLYEWPDSVSANPVSDPFMDDLYAGEYVVIVSDNVGCNETVTVLVNNSDGPQVQTDRVTSSWCGLLTGTASVNISGGTSPFTYSWYEYGNTEILSTQTSVDALAAGHYIFRVNDGTGCIAMQHIFVTDSVELEPELLFVSMDSSACSQPLGSLSVQMNDGLSPYHYQWNTSVNDTLATLNSLTAGNYSVTATDERGCSGTMSLQVVDRSLPAMRFIRIENAYCGHPSGKFFLQIDRGRGPYYAFLTSNPAITYPFVYTDSIGVYMAVIDSLASGEDLYSMRGVDADGCESNTLSNYIDDENPMQLTLLSLIPTSCYGENDGTASILVEDGVEPYTYEWSENSVNSSVNNNLSAGEFTVTVTDAMNCILHSESFLVSQPAQVRITNAIITEPSCYGFCDGQITGYAAGGTGQLRFIWNHQDTIRTITDLCAGQAILEVIDINGCSTSRNLTINEPELLSVAGMPDEAEVCEGQVYILDPGEGYTSTSWTSTNGYTSTDRAANITAAGTYFLNAMAPSGCAVADTFVLTVSDNLLNAEFLMASEAYVGDTVVIIEVSWPYADICSWTLPPEATVITDLDYYKELIFRAAGTYYVELNARLATCVAMQGKYIDIYNSVPGKSSDEPGEGIASIISSFSIYPNPARENLTMKVKLTEEQNIRVEIVSLSGNKVNDEVVGYDMSEYEVSIDVTSLMPGMYMIRLIAGDNVESKMLVVH